MVAWRSMEGHVLLSLLMLGFVTYMILAAGIPTIPLPGLLAVGQPSPSPVVVAGPVANPVEHVVLPRHSVWLP